MMEQDMMDVARDRAEAAAQYPPAVFHRMNGGEPIEGYLDVDSGAFFAKTGGAVYIVETYQRWHGDKYLVWVPEGLMGEVRLKEERGYVATRR
jgi:hypothetical protein